MVIRSYAIDHGITGDDFKLFRQFLGVLDNEWLRYVAERDKAPPEPEPS
jgi:hypothetical protein